MKVERKFVCLGVGNYVERVVFLENNEGIVGRDCIFENLLVNGRLK